MAKKRRFVLHSHINSFHYLYQDAGVFHGQMGVNRHPDPFYVTRLGRTAILLYIMSLEALINRALEAFTPDHLKEFIVERERKLSFTDKWELLPLLLSEDKTTFDKSKEPWTSFSELVKLRDDFVHPKHERPAYYEAKGPGDYKPLDWRDIPDGLDVPQSALRYSQTGIPKDPYSIKIEHVNKVKSVVDAVIAKLDELLGGKIKAAGWYTSDTFKLVFPKDYTQAEFNWVFKLGSDGGNGAGNGAS